MANRRFLGLELEIRISPDGALFLLVGQGKIKARLSTKWVNSTLTSYEVWVDPLLRRNGVATFLYESAEQFWNQSLTPYESVSGAESSLEIVEFWRKRGKILTNYPKIFDL